MLTEIKHPDSASEIAALHADIFPPEQAWSAADFVTLLTENSTEILGLRNGSKLAAIAVFQLIQPQAELLTFGVGTSWQRQGFAQALLDQSMRHLARLKIEQVILDVAADNTAAISLYAQFGFTEDGRRQNYYRRRDTTAIDAILMSKNIFNSLLSSVDRQTRI